MCTEVWGKVISHRLQILEKWALHQGLELAAECHLAKINQCSDFLQVISGFNPPCMLAVLINYVHRLFQAPKNNVAEIQQLVCSSFRLNSLQVNVLLSQEKIPKNLIDTAVRMAESVADELTKADGREV